MSIYITNTTYHPYIVVGEVDETTHQTKCAFNYTPQGEYICPNCGILDVDDVRFTVEGAFHSLDELTSYTQVECLRCDSHVIIKRGGRVVNMITDEIQLVYATAILGLTPTNVNTPTPTIFKSKLKLGKECKDKMYSMRLNRSKGEVAYCYCGEKLLVCSPVVGYRQVQYHYCPKCKRVIHDFLKVKHKKDMVVIDNDSKFNPALLHRFKEYMVKLYVSETLFNHYFSHLDFYITCKDFTFFGRDAMGCCNSCMGDCEVKGVLLLKKLDDNKIEEALNIVKLQDSFTELGEVKLKRFKYKHFVIIGGECKCLSTAQDVYTYQL